MSMSDPIADMLTRIRNACGSKHRRVDIPVSKMKTELAKEHTKVALDGDVVTLTGTKPGELVGFTFLNDTTLVGVLGDKATKAGVLAIAQGGSPLAKSAAFIDMYSRIDTTRPASPVTPGAG